MHLHRLESLRKLALPLLRIVGNIDVSIRHHYTPDKVRLNLFTHKGYWFHRRHRAEAAMRSLAMFVGKGQTVIDVGGHIGYVALYFAHLVGKQGHVFVFEPGINNLPYAKDNLCGRQNVTLVAKALADQEGQTLFLVENTSGQNNTLLKEFAESLAPARVSFTEVGYRETLVEVTELDTFVADYKIIPHFIKVDVEGAELRVLQGAQKTITRFKPSMLIEVNEGFQEREIYAFAFSHGYRVFDVHLKELTEYAAGVTPDIFCIHPSRAAAVQLS
jgi:FkbM family methyltransferase